MIQVWCRGKVGKCRQDRIQEASDFALDRTVHSSRAQRGRYSAVFVHQSLSESGEVTAAACARFGTLAEEFALRAGTTKSQKSVPQYVYNINPLWSFDF